ncbi:hypothetical protein JCM10908_001972 [Rhodotorula pacifica]|uniref:zinc finger MYND domain-containing protein n=1 Tax=Rhodotorula pacifica TaxID=1495444 RepID=UPI0031801724
MSASTAAAPSSSTAATSAPAGECLVCGASTSTRCSSCASKSGFDLFFRSKEHQKLAWPVHRLVCGDRAHPFRLPPFSQEEAELLIFRLFAKCKFKMHESAQDMLRMIIARELGVPKLQLPDHDEHLRAFVQSLVGVEVAPRTYGPSDMFRNFVDPAAKGDQVYLINKLRAGGTALAIKSSALTKSLPTAYIESFALCYNDCLDNVCLDHEPLLHAQVCHRLVALIATAYKEADPATMASPVLAAEMERLQRDILKRLRALAESTTTSDLQDFPRSVFTYVANATASLSTPILPLPGAFRVAPQ